MSSYKTIVKNIFSNWIGLSSSFIIGFLISPFIVHHLGNEIYGIWILIVSTVGYGSLLNLGIVNFIIKYTSQYYTLKDDQGLSEIFNISLLIFTILGIIVILLIIILSLYFPVLFNILPYKNDARLVLIILGFNLALIFPISVFSGLLSGIQRFDIVNGIDIVINIVRTMFIVIFLGLGYKLIALSIILLTSTILVGVLSVYFVFRYLPDLKISFRYLNKAKFKNMYRYSFYSFINDISQKTIYESGPIIIGLFLPVSNITFYAIANNLMTSLRKISFGFGNVFNPAVSALDAKNEDERIRQLVIYGTKYSLMVILPVAFTFVLFGKTFISLWMGSQYAELSGTVLAILSASQIFAMSQFSSRSILFGLNKHKYLALSLMFQAFLNLSLSIILIGKYGVIGLALGNAMAEIVVSVFILSILITKITKLSVVRYVKEALCPPFLSTVSLIFLLSLFKTYLNHVSWTGFILEVSTAVIIYGIGSIFLCFSSEERSLISGVFMRRFKSLAQAEKGTL